MNPTYTSYHDRGTDYKSQKGVTIKTERYDYEPGHPEKNLRKDRGEKNILNVI